MLSKNKKTEITTDIEEQKSGVFIGHGGSSAIIEYDNFDE
jgi:hypothetical protein